MLGLIKILNDSVVLYQNWIHEDEWEHIYSFPHGGLTFKIANDNIKFFATKDYFYRNLICSFDFPVHIIDELNGIDGDYSDEEEIAEILNRIYPLEQTSGIDLGLYLQKKKAEELYQPKGDYITPDDLEEYTYNREQIDQMIDDISGITEDDVKEIVSGMTYIKPQIDDVLDGKADKDDVYTKPQADAKFISQIKTINHQSLIGTGNIDISGSSITVDSALSTASTNPVQNKVITNALRTISGNTYTKAQADSKFISQIKTINNQSLIGTGNIDIGSGGTIDVDDTLSSSSTNPVQNKVITNALKTVSGNTYTKAQADAKFLTEHQPIKTINHQSLIGTGNIDISGSSITVDSVLSTASTNPVQNKVITNALNNKVTIGTVYTKTESDNKYQEKGNYVTNATLLQYINNLQEQINSIVSTMEDCCSSTAETIYRWITMTGATDYVCSGTSKYAKEKRQYSNDNGVTWHDVSPAEYRRGDLIEEQSVDCGFKFKVKVYPGLYGREYEIITGAGYTAASQMQPYSAGTETVILGTNCLGIGGESFKGYFSMTSITFSNTVTSIQWNAFENCSRLTSITIPSSVTNIDCCIFKGCNSLNSITILATTPPSLDSLDDPNNCPIYVPASSLNAYKTATGWSQYASRIQAIP